jgi:hypothetical protein
MSRAFPRSRAPRGGWDDGTVRDPVCALTNPKLSSLPRPRKPSGPSLSDLAPPRQCIPEEGCTLAVAAVPRQFGIESAL